MENGATGRVGLACVPGAIPAAGRATHRDLMHALFGELVHEVEPLPDGYRFVFPAEALGPVARWVANERLCCPFLAFAIEVSPDHGPVRLRLTGPAGTRELLDAELAARPGAPG